MNLCVCCPDGMDGWIVVTNLFGFFQRNHTSKDIIMNGDINVSSDVSGSRIFVLMTKDKSRAVP